MTKFEKTQNEIFFKKMISNLKEGGLYVWPNIMATFVMRNGKLVAQTAQDLKAARSIVSKKAGQKLFA